MSDSGPQDDPPPTVIHHPIVIPPRTTITTRKQTSTYGKLATRKTKEELINHPSIYSSITTADHASKHLSERLLIQTNQDPDHSALCLALLNIAHTAPSITAIAADTICSIAILINALPPHPSTLTPTSNLIQQPLIPPQLNTITVNLEAQVTSLLACIANICETTQVNKTATETLTRTIDEVRNDLHNTTQVINDSVEELSGIPSQIKDAIPTNHSSLPHHIAHNTPYRDVLIQEPQPTNTTLPISPPCPDGTRANAAIKERQILLDIDANHPLLKGDTPCSEINDMIQKALMSLQEIGGPSLKIKALIQLRNGGFIIELPTPEAATWIRDPTRKLALTESLGSDIWVKHRTYNLLISFVPITTRIDDNKTLRNIEQDNDIPCNSIIQMKWIKDPSRHEENQRVAHALMSLNSPKAANRLISEGIYYDLGKLHARKDKKDPLHCLKCQHWGHMARNCTETKDTCGTCGGGHHHMKCNSYCTYYCANCKTNAHSSADKGCPEYQIQLAILNARTLENQMPYFPTEEPWTQVLLPPKPTGPIIHPHTPSTEAPQPNATVLRQQTINWTANHQEGKDRQSSSGPVINSRTLVPLRRSKPRHTPPPPRPIDADGANIPNPSASSDPTQEPTTIPHTAPHTVPMPFPLPSPLHLPGGLPITPQAIHDHPMQEETSPPPHPLSYECASGTTNTFLLAHLAAEPQYVSHSPVNST